MFEITYRLLLAYSFFVYLFIAYFENKAFLLPFLLIPINYIILLCKIGINKNEYSYYFIFLVCSFSIILSLYDVDIEWKDFIYALNFLYIIPAYFYSTYLINNYEKFIKYINIFIYSGIIMALYSLKQVTLGYDEFEINALSMMGSTLKEYFEMGRLRVASTTLDPLLASFIFGICLYLASIKIYINYFNKKKIKIFDFLLIAAFFIAMAATLTRAPMLGVIIGFLFVLIKFGLFIKGISLIALIFFASQMFLKYFEINYLNEVYESFYSLFQLFENVDINDENYFLVGQSRDHRLMALKLAIEHIIEKFMGDGILSSKIQYLDFSLQDIGILSAGIKYGLVTYLMIQIFYFKVLISSLENTKKCDDEKGRYVGYILSGLWVMIIVSVNISDISSGIIPGLYIGSIAAVINNFHVIFSKDIKNG
jgi:hypothetical protein